MRTARNAKPMAFVMLVLLTFVLSSCTSLDGNEATNVVTYRFLGIGVGKYAQPGFADFGEAPPYQVVYSVLSKWKFNNGKIGFSSIIYISDLEATKKHILESIQSALGSADDNDVSYFYFGGHGGKNGDVYYLSPGDADSSIASQITVDELAEAFQNIRGTKIVILDACYSGGFIEQSRAEENPIHDAKAFHEAIKRAFGSGQYRILTSCGPSQISQTVNFEGYTIGAFTAALLEGCGYRTFLADANSDRRVTLEEIHVYAEERIRSFGLEQDVMVYPPHALSSSFAEY